MVVEYIRLVVEFNVDTGSGIQGCW